MKAMFEVEHPDAVEFTLSVTMKLRDWRQLRENLKGSDSAAAWKLRTAIADMILQAEKTFYPAPTP